MAAELVDDPGVRSFVERKRPLVQLALALPFARDVRCLGRAPVSGPGIGPRPPHGEPARPGLGLRDKPLQLTTGAEACPVRAKAVVLHEDGVGRPVPAVALRIDGVEGLDAVGADKEHRDALGAVVLVALAIALEHHHEGKRGVLA